MPVLGTVDYSPIISSLNARGRAGQANISERYEDLKQQEKTRQAVAGTIDGAFKLAGTVVGLIEQADLEKNKSKVVDFQVEAAKRIDNAINTGQWEYDPNGNLQIKSDFAEWYKEQREALAGQAKTTKVRRWMQDQVDETYKNLATQATGMLVRRQAQETNAALEDTIANEMTIALDTGDFSPIEASINSNPFWTDTFKAQRLDQAKKDFRILGASREATRLNLEQGPEAAEAYLKSISGVGEEAKAKRDEGVYSATADYAAKVKEIEQRREAAKKQYQEAQEAVVKEGVNLPSKDVKKRLKDEETKYQSTLDALDQEERNAEQDKTARASAADEDFRKANAMSEKDIAAARAAYQTKYKNELTAQQGQADIYIKQAAEQGVPMGAAVEKYIEQAKPGLRADLKAYAEKQRDAAMWEQFQQKANAPGADLMELYHQIKGNAPGKSGYTGHYDGAQVEQTRELNYLAGILGLEKESGSAAASKWAEGQIAAWKTKVETGGASVQEAVKFLTGDIFDVEPEKCTSAIAYIMKRESPAYASTIAGLNSYVAQIAKDKKLNATQKEQLEGVLRHTLRQSFYDKPNMNAADFANLQTTLTNAVVVAGSKFMTELATPGWFKSTDDGLGKFMQRLEENPTLANAFAFTEAQFDRKEPYRTVLNPFVADKVNQLRDRGRTMLAEVTGTDAGEIVMGYQSEGPWDISALPEYSMKGKDGKVRTFILTAPDGKLGFIETTGGKRVPVEPPKKPKTDAKVEPVSDDFWNIGADTFGGGVR